MTLTKKDIIESVINRVHLTNRKRERQRFLFPELNYTLLKHKRAGELVDAVLEIMKSNLEKGENVLISGFGKFQVRFKWARKGRNPKTGKGIILKSRRTVVFHCSSTLKDRMNRNQ
ncbi:MAG: integration host factor subunit alpha [Deltaproteobacteria bacterium]|nr:integration host factor subunit alpha [Deltaproteobacteria bacterium]